MASRQNTVSVNIRIICVSPPADTYEGKSVSFGLQDKSQNLVYGQHRDNALVFALSIDALKVDGQPQPDWRGIYAHGTPGQRFLYLSYGYRDDAKWHWIKRIKIMLSGITWQHIETASANNGYLEATIDGSRAATVKLLGEGWTFKAS